MTCRPLVTFTCFYFSEQPTSIFGDSLRQQVEDRLKFYESGEAPRKNVEVMEEALALAESEVHEDTTSKKKKKKKRKAAELDETAENGDETLNSTNGNKEAANGEENGDEPKKKKKKKKNKNKEE